MVHHNRPFPTQLGHRDNAGLEFDIHESRPFIAFELSDRAHGMVGLSETGAGELSAGASGYAFLVNSVFLFHQILFACFLLFC